MASRVVRDVRRPNKRKAREVGAGIRRSDIRRRNSSSIVRRESQFPEVSTVFGKLATVVAKPFEVGFEVMAANSSTGTIYNDTGTLTILGRIGTLHISKEIDGKTWYGKIREGDFATFEPGDQYSLGAGNNAVDFIRIQTPDYIAGIKSLSPPVHPDNPQNIHIATMRQSRTHGEADVDQPTVHRASYSKAHRERVAAMVAGDRNQNAKRRGVTREARPNLSAEEVLSRNEFESDSGMVTGINPRPIGAAAAEMEMQAAVQMSQAPPKSE